MTSARKPGDPGRISDSLPADDPSIPVLTERLTLPPLDLDLDFRLPPRPGHGAEPPTTAPEPRPVPLADEAKRFAPLDDKTLFAAPEESSPFRTPDDERRFAAPEDAAQFRTPELDAAFDALDEQTRYLPASRQPPAEEDRYGFDDEATRLVPSPRRAFERMEGPATQGPATQGPATQGPATRGPTTQGPTTQGPMTQGPMTRAPAAPAPGLSGPETVSGPSTRSGGDSRLGVDSKLDVDTRGGPHTAMPPEPADTSPRVPTSLLVSNLNTLLSTPTQTHRKPQPDDFDLTSTDSGQDSRDLDNELRERILLGIARQLPTEVDTIVRRHLENAIEEAVRRFTAKVRIALAGSLREIVDRGVKTELERLKTPRGQS